MAKRYQFGAGHSLPLGLQSGSISHPLKHQTLIEMLVLLL